MRLARRILITIAVMVVGFIVVVDFIVPDTISYYLKKTASAPAYVVPTDLQDLSVSQAPGMKLTYFGYEFEVPWSDLRDAERKPYASKNSGEEWAWVTFQSGLRMSISAAPGDAASSSYDLAQLLYEFNPTMMHAWPPSPKTQYRQLMLLTGKSLILSQVPSKSVETGIFKLRSHGYRGFQLGNPRMRPDGLRIQLYSNDGSFEITLCQVGYEEPAGITQPEINRIIQSLHRVTSDGAPSPLRATSN